jgi:hypothetical protein
MCLAQAHLGEVPVSFAIRLQCCAQIFLHVHQEISAILRAYLFAPVTKTYRSLVSVAMEHPDRPPRVALELRRHALEIKLC